MDVCPHKVPLNLPCAGCLSEKLAAAEVRTEEVKVQLAQALDSLQSGGASTSQADETCAAVVRHSLLLQKSLEEAVELLNPQEVRMDAGPSPSEVEKWLDITNQLLEREDGDYPFDPLEALNALLRVYEAHGLVMRTRTAGDAQVGDLMLRPGSGFLRVIANARRGEAGTHTVLLALEGDPTVHGENVDEPATLLYSQTPSRQGAPSS